MMDYLRTFLERPAFGLCNYLGLRMGIASSRVRLYFIYLSFLTFGSPVILYFVAVFWLNVKEYIRRGRNLVWQ